MRTIYIKHCLGLFKNIDYWYKAGGGCGKFVKITRSSTKFKCAYIHHDKKYPSRVHIVKL